MSTAFPFTFSLLNYRLFSAAREHNRKRAVDLYGRCIFPGGQQSLDTNSVWKSDLRVLLIGTGSFLLSLLVSQGDS